MQKAKCHTLDLFVFDFVIVYFPSTSNAVLKNRLADGLSKLEWSIYFKVGAFVMFPKKGLNRNSVVHIHGKPFRKRVILADANIPYKLSIDRINNNLFFCINADEFSDQSFHSAFVDLNTGVPSIIPGIRNGFASTVDNSSGTVYLGGSKGIYKFNYNTNDVKAPPVIDGIDIFDMYFHKELYFVDTTNQNLYVYRNAKKKIVPEVEGCLIHHFIIDKSDDLIFISSSGLFKMSKNAKSPTLFDTYPRDLNFRGIATNMNGEPYFIAQDGIYELNGPNNQLVRILVVNNGYGLAFDKDDNIVYSDERSITKLVPFKSDL